MAKVSSEIKPVIRSIDVGFGYTKYSAAEDNGIVYKSFPSIAPRSSKIENSDLSMINERDTIIVTVDGTAYEVGPDSLLLETSDTTRTLNDQYIHTAQYKALTYGALAYMNEESIDLLVVGLPVSNYESHHEALKRHLIGVHKINEKFSCNIKNVLVVYQPLGGLTHCMSLSKTTLANYDLEYSMNLIIDPGFLTVDFLLANGNKMIENKSGAHNGGVSRILNAIADSISKKLGKKYENYNAIDRALKRRKLKIAGKDEDLLEHIKNTKSVIESPITYMKNMIGDGSDIDNIILLGGGANIFEKTLKENFKDREIIVIEDPSFANVKGYQIIGEDNYTKLVKDVAVTKEPKE
jgi:plasmid segregation protein ParM